MSRHRLHEPEPEPAPEPVPRQEPAGRRAFHTDGGSLGSVLREALLRRQADRSGRYTLAEEPRPCWHCSAPTRFLEINFEAPLCPGACTEAKEADYWRALSEGVRRDREERLCEDS
jgi:hypothetical protein